MRLASAVHPLSPMVLVTFLVTGGSAVAGPALDDDKARLRPVPSTEDPDELNRTPDVEYGVGVRLRSVWLPTPVIDLFVARSAGGAQNFGFGLDLTRRRGASELQLGFEYERINVGQGVWIARGEDVASGNEADYVLGPKDAGDQFAWLTAEFTFIHHTALNNVLAIRYGAGLGIGVMIGEIRHYNIICAAGTTNANPEPGCVPQRFGGDGTYSEGREVLQSYNMPPVFPVINAILGLQIRPSDNITINLEGGLRTLPFAGISSSIFF